MNEIQPYNYQNDALKFIREIFDKKGSFFLAFEMGLGKTIVTLLLLRQILKNHEISKFLLVVGKSLINDVWVRELKNNFQDIKYMVYHGNSKKTNYDYNLQKDLINMSNINLVITTYNTLYNDSKYFDFKNFSIIVLDEFHNYINSEKKIKIFNFLKENTAQNRRLVLSGTIIKNREEEIDTYRKFINNDKFNKLDDNIFFLSQESQAGILSMPKKEEYIIRIPTHKYIKSRINELRISNVRNLHFILLPLLSMPKDISIEQCEEVSYKAKIFLKIVKFLVQKKQKVIVFSSYVHTLRVLAGLLLKHDVNSAIFYGKQGISERTKRLNDFKELKDIPVLLISTKAGGEGLNIQEANYVIIFDPWWNPQKIVQAIARSYRQGQKKKVFVINLIYNEDEMVVDNMNNKKIWNDRYFNRETITGKEIIFDESAFSHNDTIIDDFLNSICIENESENNIKEDFFSNIYDYFLKYNIGITTSSNYDDLILG